MKLSITEEAMGVVLKAAVAAGGNECMGLMAGPRGGGRVTTVCLLPSQASPWAAEAAPLDLRRAVAAFEALGVEPEGLWHSHGQISGDFHSGIDVQTTDRLLPAMAEWHFVRPKPAVAAPAVTGPDTAVLPLEDGMALRLTLLGPPIAGLLAHGRAAWAGVRTSFGEAGLRPRTVFEDGTIRLEGGGVVLTLGVPEDATVSVFKEDAAPCRVAQLYSLVVNSRKERSAECLTVYEFGEDRVMKRSACEVEVVKDGGGSGAAVEVVGAEPPLVLGGLTVARPSK
jgi:proteasome lid subunit RPN8/RPN11